MSKDKTFVVIGQCTALMLLLVACHVQADTIFKTATLQTEAYQKEGWQAEKEITAAKEIEKIDVIGKQPPNLLRKAFYRHEDNFFDLYNELVDENQFRMDCEMRLRHLDTRVKKRECIPRYVEIENAKQLREAALRNGRVDAASFLGAVPDRAGLRLVYEKKKKQMATKMAELINSHPELTKRYTQYVEAKTKFEDAKNR
ncbi:hypothetical protein [Alteromonas sp. BMJM2]|uniref:hypothetical protein n=1 Tax=Alteromonas sp. BMJM2 TaxID=2954241 RepID=UPI0022B48F91|nr:hypothetical protein [Alteromonas sp. BMJM2]